MVDPKTTKYRNIKISGIPGCGSSTLGKGISKKLEWEYFSGGDFMRKYAIEKNLFDKNSKVHHLATVYSDDFDRKVDYGMRESLQTDSGRVLDSWLSGFTAQSIEGTLKILVYCSSDEIRVDRIVNRDGISIKEAKRHIFEREDKNLEKWTRMYKKEWDKWVPEKYRDNRKGKFLDFYCPELYDLAIDTFSNNKEETLKIVLKEMGL